MILGRFGCLAMGVNEPTYGLPTDSFLGVDLGDGVPRHATAAYEIVFLSLLWLLLRYYQPTLREGRLFQWFMVAYLGYRLLVGFIQPHTFYWCGLGSIQWACVLGLLYYAVDFRRVERGRSA